MINKTDEIILDFLKAHPRRLADIRHHVGVSDFGCLHRLNKLEASGKIAAVRDGSKSTVYHLAPANENQEEKENDAFADAPQTDVAHKNYNLRRLAENDSLQQ